MLGKRQAEITEPTLTNVYEMEEILRSAREPLALAQEMAKKDGVRDEIANDSNYSPEARLLEHLDFFGRFRSQKCAFAAIFGRRAAEQLDGLWRRRLEINVAIDAPLLHKDRTGANSEHRAFLQQQRSIALRITKG